MVKHNNVIPNGHFKKHWQNYVKTWFNQPARKQRRRIGNYPIPCHALLMILFHIVCKSGQMTTVSETGLCNATHTRQKRAVKIFPRPTAGPLRPIVQCQTRQYNMKSRAGRGFILEELKAAGIPKKLAPTVDISVDHRRKNRSLEGLQSNVQRLKTYKAKLVIFPRRARKVKVRKLFLPAGDSTPEELATANQVQGEYMPITRGEKRSIEVVKVTDEMKESGAYKKLRLERMNKRHQGMRQKKAAEAEKEDKK
ncbi:hypothetical protein C2845_PM10G00490 [Panicum miliaceum]|uniref:60S ribosomal protein L13 n=1 Tax=Panicum miliaceum TaxID=4540 RepID=A0A3L6PER0_PANMI|nr:hypothetical protein C2845_PM10G00490 [Panicum miliaceum]